MHGATIKIIDLHGLNPGNVHLNNLNASVLNVLKLSPIHVQAPDVTIE